MSLKLSLEHRMDITQGTPAGMMHRGTSKDLKCLIIQVLVAIWMSCRCKRTASCLLPLTYSSISPGWQSGALCKYIKNLLHQNKLFAGYLFPFVVHRKFPDTFFVFHRFPYGVSQKKTEIVAAYIVGAFKGRSYIPLFVCKGRMVNSIFQYFTFCFFY